MEIDSTPMTENVDCVTINGTPYTPANIKGSFDISRDRYFDLPLEAKPVVSESRRVRNPDRLSSEQREYLDSAPYDFDNSSTERRFRTEFDYYAALIRAAEDNADQLFQLKRRVTARSHIITARYREMFDMCVDKYGSKTMGTNQNDRKSWFHMKYPALAEISDLYTDFLEEINIELDRWQQFAAAASRGLTATEMSYRATGRLYDRHSGKYENE